MQLISISPTEVEPLSTSHPCLLNFVFLAAFQTAPLRYLNVNGTHTVVYPKYPEKRLQYLRKPTITSAFGEGFAHLLGF